LGGKFGVPSHSALTPVRIINDLSRYAQVTGSNVIKTASVLRQLGQIYNSPELASITNLQAMRSVVRGGIYGGVSRMKGGVPVSSVYRKTSERMLGYLGSRRAAREAAHSLTIIPKPSFEEMMLARDAKFKTEGVRAFANRFDFSARWNRPGYMERVVNRYANMFYSKYIGWDAVARKHVWPFLNKGKALAARKKALDARKTFVNNFLAEHQKHLGTTAGLSELYASEGMLGTRL
jgi:hypothetical protein